MSTLTHEEKTTGTILRERLKQKFGRKGGCLLLDTSGSMDGSPIRKLGEIAGHFRAHRRYVFNTDVRELQASDAIGDAEGGTNMALAFMRLKDDGVNHAVVITDGLPNDPTQALEEAEGLKLDIIYVGPDPAPEFLERLAKATGGRYGKADLDFIRELTEKVRALLEPPKESINL